MYISKCFSPQAIGRGVFAARDIAANIIIDTCPVLVLDPVENKEHVEKTSLFHYTYNWPYICTDGKATTSQAVVLGLGSMFNHAVDQNVGWKRDVAQQLVTYRTLRPVKAGEELCEYTVHLLVHTNTGKAYHTEQGSPLRT
ncbi:hypothetical protein M501DRAFT_1001724 [Patellaria atrata CBS 101060]|uniref:SET domain-containing protein n=1 Tax=Patellaria atrata CBS 101060 TaxID=1346257 RepID=A0A9P4SF71_9PEZI|nr:hypothetical protein M501DRAFT_1001724 [Patellaria atrata CBS 101060]